MRYFLMGVAALALIGCEPTATDGPVEQSAPQAQSAPQPPKLSRSAAAANFRAVVRTMEPVAEQECKRRSPDLNCDFKIVLDERRNQPPNAFQTLDRSGRPIIGFTVALIADARNRDEVAFVMGHEAAHHIRRHLIKQRDSAIGGQIAGTLIGAALGLDTNILGQVGGTIGARAFSKEHELEADALGTVITKRAGYDPVRGAQFFTRIPDPGDRFLGTHPPNAQRITTVRRVNSQL